jgi:uncharacterized membrane protein YbhN (UPF0104 family)
MPAKQQLARQRALLKNPVIKRTLVIVLLLLTVGLFINFFRQHPEYIRQLGHTNPWWIVAVIALNIPMIGLLVIIYDACLQLCGKRMGLRENFLLTSYSSLVNFFGPLQSGPGVRAVYLKTKHQIRLRDYTLATLLYYALFASFSALFLLAGNRPWWQTLVVFCLVVGFSGSVIKFFVGRDKKPSDSQFKLSRRPLVQLIIATFAQVLLSAITYYVELKAVDPHVHWGQAAAYSGAANFALFVSLTPDAIGFRETFLVLSQKLHHISTGHILSANIIDRGAYLIFLLLLFVFVLAVHAKERLRPNSALTDKD